MTLPDGDDDNDAHGRQRPQIELTEAHARLEALMTNLGQEPLPETFDKIRAAATALLDLTRQVEQLPLDDEDRSANELYAQAAQVLAALPNDPLAAQPALRAGFALAEQARQRTDARRR